MDRERFDALTRLVAARGSRRAALGALLGTLALGHEALAKGGKHKGSQEEDDGGTRRCYPGKKCVPGTAHTNTRCDFSGSNAFHALDAQGSNLSGSNFTGADLAGADLRAVNLSDSCLVNATLRDAIVNESTNFHRVIFCNTTMPDGSILNSGCDRGRRCCPTPAPRPVCGSNIGCELDRPCGPDCFCVSSVEGAGACIDANFADCSAPACETSDDCGPGGFCVDVSSSDCCAGTPSTAVCFPSDSVCGIGGGGGVVPVPVRRSASGGWRTTRRSR